MAERLRKERVFMGKKPVLVIMAAGMGSRYGGLKPVSYTHLVHTGFCVYRRNPGTSIAPVRHFKN